MSLFRFVRRATLVAFGVCAALWAVSPALAAQPGTLRAIDLGAPSLGRSVSIASPGGGTFSATPGRAQVRVTPNGGTPLEIAAWCVDPTRLINEGIDYEVEIETPADTPTLTSPGFQAAGWLIAAADGLLGAASDPGLEAAAIQVAVWRLTGRSADIDAVTSDARLNARAAELRALAIGRAPVTVLAATGPSAPVAPGASATVTISGTAGAVVDLSVSSGAASLSSRQVTIGATGSTTVAVTPSAAGAVTVTATAQGGALERSVHLAGARVPQDLAYIVPKTLTATATLTVTAAPVAGPAAPAPSITATAPAALAIVKAAPAQVRRGRVIDYRITVTNPSAQTATRLVIRDRLPAGTALRRIPAGARLVSGAVVWRIDSLGPGRSVTVRLSLRTDAVTGDVVDNRATAAAANAPTARAQTRTRLTAAPRVVPVVVAPVVTG